MHVHSHPVATDDAPVPHDVQQPRGHSTDAAGQATPAISAITLLTLVFLSSWQLQRLPQLSFPVELDNLSIRQFVPILRTPPPRPVLLVSALYR